MNLLAFDTSTDQLSIAVARRGSAQVWTYTGPGGAQASPHLIPEIMALLAQAELSLSQLDAIAFGAGPGSFTGLRSACAVAQGLGYGANVPLLPVDTLLAVAEQARGTQTDPAAPLNLLAVLDARMDEVYSARCIWQGGQWQRPADWEVGKPETLTLEPGWQLAGNAFAAYGPRLPQGPQIAALPTASAMLRLAPALLAAGLAVPAAQALPRYIRDKVAQTTAERAAIKAAAVQATAADMPQVRA